jgi:signal transduction histidine kinase
MERYRKAAVWASLAFGIIILAVLFSEIKLIDPSQRTLYIWTKLLFVATIPPLTYFLNKDINSQPANILTAIIWFSYPIHGQFFRPLYVFSYCQVVTIFSFLFPLSKKAFRIIASVSFISLMAVLFYHQESFLDQMRHPVMSDFVFIVFCFFIIGWLANTFFTSERLFREEAVLKFAKIGTQTSRIVHDLKGLTSSPLLYLQVLESQLPESLNREVGEAMALLSRDLEGFRRTLFELNQLTASKSQEKSIFSFSEVLSSLQVILKKQLTGVELEIVGELSLETDKNLLTSVILNILVNSVDTFKQRKIANGKISVCLDQNEIHLRDNGGGFEDTVLKAILTGRFISTRSDGSGLGLLFVFDGMKKMGGRAKVFNSNGGAAVTLFFPKSSVRERHLLPPDPLPLKIE